MSTIGLWGRSMGAVTAIMYGDRDPSVAGMVLDSPFSSLKKLVEELVKDRVSLPNFVLNQALSLVKSTVKKKAKFELDNIEPIKFAERCFIPALFVSAKDDMFVQPHHSKILCDIYQGDKNIISVDGDHNSIRPKFFKDSAAIFFYNTLQVKFLKEISDNYAGFIYKKNQDNEEDNNKKEIKENDNLKQIEQNIDDDEDNEEEMFQKIIELSKKEFEKMNNEENKENKK